MKKIAILALTLLTAPLYAMRRAIQRKPLSRLTSLAEMRRPYNNGKTKKYESVLTDPEVVTFNNSLKKRTLTLIQESIDRQPDKSPNSTMCDTYRIMELLALNAYRTKGYDELNIYMSTIAIRGIGTALQDLDSNKDKKTIQQILNATHHLANRLGNRQEKLDIREAQIMRAFNDLEQYAEDKTHIDPEELKGLVRAHKHVFKP